MANRRKKNQTSAIGHIFRKIFYYSIVAMIAYAAYSTYFFWFDTYNYSHPRVMQTESGVYTEELPFDGVLLWNERIIHSQAAGKLNLPSPGARRVRKSEPLCSVGVSAIRSPGAGYFIPGLDGFEGKWSYSKLWTGTSSLPVTNPVNLMKNGANIEAKQAIGKLIPQPQELRAIAWIDLTPSLQRDIDKRRIRIKRKEDEWGIWAEIRTTETVAQRAKIYLSLPFFSPDMLKQRSFSWKVVVGERHGVYVPNSSVILRDGEMGIYIVRRNEAIFKKIEAFHVDEDNFFITSGITPGDLIIIDANRAREGQVNIW